MLIKVSLMFAFDVKKNLKCIQSSGKEAKESCTDKGTMVANIYNPEVF